MSIQKDVSTKQEKEVAQILGGEIVPGSGSTAFEAGDVSTDYALIECKTTTKEQTSFSIKKEWMDKIREQAFEQGKEFGALAFRFKPDGMDFVVLPIAVFSELISQSIS